MTDYPAGTVALVTHKGERVRAFYDELGDWTLANGLIPDAPRITDITPLVVLELDRVDAEKLHAAMYQVNRSSYAAVISRVVDAVCQQIPRTSTSKPPVTEDDVRRIAREECEAVWERARSARRGGGVRVSPRDPNHRPMHERGIPD